MLQITDRQLHALHLLRDVVWPFVEEKERDGFLNFDAWGFTTSCGTYACLLGWAGIHKQFPYIHYNPDTFEWTDINGEVDDYPLTSLSRNIFRLSTSDNLKMFSISDHGTLSDRKALLNKIIAEREAALSTTPETGPEPENKHSGRALSYVE
jgi:hypothetical protein